MLGTLADLLGNANGQTPLALLLAGVLVLGLGVIARQAFASQRRQGARLGRVEKLLESERIRRRQIEQCIREGRDLPYWPGDPAELYAVTAQIRAARDEQDQAPAGAFDEVPETRFITEQERALYARHRR